jgi:hypothetical protein
VGVAVDSVTFWAAAGGAAAPNIASSMNPEAANVLTSVTCRIESISISVL